MFQCALACGLAVLSLFIISGSAYGLMIQFHSAELHNVQSDNNTNITY